MTFWKMPRSWADWSASACAGTNLTPATDWATSDHSAPDFTQPDPAARKKEVERTRDMFRVTAELGGRNAEQAKLVLRRRGINTSSPVREDAVIDMDEKRATSAIRLSPHYYNTSDEIDRAVAALVEVIETLEPTRRA